MINFEEELQKFKPILEIEKIEESINGDEIFDIVDLLRKVTKENKI